MIAPPATLGMLGGGQLGMYFVLAARRLGYRTVVLDPDPTCPAAAVADLHMAAPYDDSDAIARLAAECAAVSTEFENVPAATLERLAESTTVHPNADAVATSQDRIAEKAFLRSHGIPVGPYAVIETDRDLDRLPGEVFPGVLKTARLGYDGRGQTTVAAAADAKDAWADHGRVPCVLERRLDLDLELSVVLARTTTGDVATFTPPANTHRNGILDISTAPSGADPAIVADAERLAAAVADALDFVGTVAVEFFVSKGTLLVNEIAPRPHNSGHFTLDACVTSQFEQQVRALCGLPLGDPRPHSAATMVNLLGDLWFPTAEDPAPRQPDWPALLAFPDLRLHLYGKREPRPGRKMGHFTVLAPDPDTALATARDARTAIGITDDNH